MQVWEEDIKIHFHNQRGAYQTWCHVITIYGRWHRLCDPTFWPYSLSDGKNARLTPGDQRIYFYDADHFCEIITSCEDLIAAIMRWPGFAKIKIALAGEHFYFYGNCGCMQGEKGESGSLRERCCHFIVAAPHWLWPLVHLSVTVYYFIYLYTAALPDRTTETEQN